MLPLKVFKGFFILKFYWFLKNLNIMARVILFTDYGDTTTLQIVSNGSLFQLTLKDDLGTKTINLDEATAKTFSKHTRTIIAEVIENKKGVTNG